MEWILTGLACVAALSAVWAAYKLSLYVYPPSCQWLASTDRDGHCNRCGQDWENFMRPMGCTDPTKAH